MKRIMAMVLCFAFALSLIGCGNKFDDKEKGEPTITIVIDNAVYCNTGRPVPVEPDESAIEYVEIPVGEGAVISAFARLEDEKMIVCLMDGEWYQFAATDRGGQP